MYSMCCAIMPMVTNSYRCVDWRGGPAAKEYTYDCRVACIIGTYALSEELSKFYMFRRRLKKIEGEHTWLDLIVYSAIVGIGFGLLESIIFVVDSSPLEMLIRGICIPHGGA